MSRSVSTPQASVSPEIPADHPDGGFGLPAYRAPLWLPGGHLQTIGSALIGRQRSSPLPDYQRERWTTPDRDFIDVDWLREPIAPADLRPLLVLFHGLEGSSHSHYARSFAAYAEQRGWDYAVPHFRGCSGEINLAPRAYHSGDYSEIDWILRRMRQQHIGPIIAVGISLGGNALLRWGQEAGLTASSLVDCIAAICAPIDLAAGGWALGRGLNRHIYTPMFLRSMKPKAMRKLKQHPGLFDGEELQAARTLYEFDNVFTAPLHGFKDTDDYWARASAKPHLHLLRIPTLILHARNDPFVPARSLPTKQQAGPYVSLWQPSDGGHVGFAEGLPPGHLRYLPQQVGQWLEMHLK